LSTPSLLTNHAFVLLCVARDPEMTLRGIAGCVGISERATHAIVCDLERAGYVSRRRAGRRNRYEVHAEAPLAPRAEVDVSVGDLLAALGLEASLSDAS
jgi:hypothetical protein